MVSREVEGIMFGMWEIVVVGVVVDDWVRLWVEKVV